MSKINFTKWLRIIHRDLGFLMIGITCVYGISGITLNHMNGKDPSFKTVENSVTLESGLSSEQLKTAWEGNNDLPSLRKIAVLDPEHYRVMLNGGIGVYNKVTGNVDYEVHKRKEFIYWVNRLHYNKINGWNYMGDFFAVSLIFFAVSGIFMVKGKKGILGRGKWYLIAGLIIPILYIIFS